jgi:hypothetical protein
MRPEGKSWIYRRWRILESLYEFSFNANHGYINPTFTNSRQPWVSLQNVTGFWSLDEISNLGMMIDSWQGFDRGSYVEPEPARL